MISISVIFTFFHVHPFTVSHLTISDNIPIDSLSALSYIHMYLSIVHLSVSCLLSKQNSVNICTYQFLLHMSVSICSVSSSVSVSVSMFLYVCVYVCLSLRPSPTLLPSVYEPVQHWHHLCEFVKQKHKSMSHFN